MAGPGSAGQRIFRGHGNAARSERGIRVGGRTITGHADIDAGWADAPFDPEALTVNIGDLLAYWSGDRWLSGRHRVLPPQPSAPDEDLLTLVYFYHLDHDAVVTPLAPPIGKGTSREPVLSGVHLEAKLDAISVG